MKEKSWEELPKELVRLRPSRVRESVAERVRMDALAMRSSDDLAKVVVMQHEMVKAGVESPRGNRGFLTKTPVWCATA